MLSAALAQLARTTWAGPLTIGICYFVVGTIYCIFKTVLPGGKAIEYATKD